MESPINDEPASAESSKTFGREYTFEVKKPVGAMSISPCGRDVVLASRQGLHVIDLDSPYRTPRHLPHYTPWEVADVQWSPFPSRDYWVVSTSNQKALVWNLTMSDARSAVEHYLHAHTRAITDINFSAHHPDVLATCAVDSFVHCWDLRHPSRPALSFADWFAGATQVKWNRQDPHIIASSHDKVLHVWDDRKGAHPLHSIEAHDTKIYGLDWNRTRTSALITCSLDKTIKFWDYSISIEEPERIIKTSFPIWRARHTPFGHGVLAMPQRDDNDLYLYRRQVNDLDQDISSPIKSFRGHEGHVKEFLWRCRGNVDEQGVDHREFQLVTWGADKSLRLHPMDESSLAMVGYTKEMKADSNMRLTRVNAQYKTFRDNPSRTTLNVSKSSSSLDHRLQTALLPGSIKSGMTLRGRSAAAMGGFLNSRTTGQTGSADKNDLNPIAWMKGVKAGKKDVTLDQSGNPQVMLDHRPHRGSEEFETLGEEIVHVGTKFSKVKFEKAEDKQRYIKFGMRGIWEKNGTSTYLECMIEFPEDYPFGSTPHLTIEKTARLDRDVLYKLEKDVQTIADAYLEVKRNSLEAILRYLHGDQSLEDALNWTKQDLDSSIAELPAIDDSSSDEDDLGIAGQDLDTEYGLTDSGFLEPTNINAHMPLAKPCAGIWAHNGTLVCFFPPKKEPPTLSGSLRLSRPIDLYSFSKRKMMGGFGKVNKSETSRSAAQSTTSLDYYDDSTTESESSDSEASSSASSTSSRGHLTRDVAIFTQHMFRGDHPELGNHSAEKFLDGTLASAGSGSVLRSKAHSSKSVLTLHDYRDLLPPKEHLAKEYKLSGPGVCYHNFEVATKHGYEELAEVWILLGYLLVEDMPTKDFTSTATRSTYLRAEQNTGSLERWYPRFNLPMMSSKQDFLPHNWYGHPFGRQRLVEQLFDYYARLGDVQMLAMMSCILSKHEKPEAFTTNEPRSARQRPKVSPAIAKQYDKGYFPIVKSSTSISPEDKISKTRAASLRSPAKSTYDLNSLSSSLGTVVNDNGSLESSVRDNRSFEARSVTPKLSSSPEWIRPLHKSSSTLANAFMTSLPRPFSLTTSAASSPPSGSFAKKKISPISSLTATHNGWISGGMLGLGVDNSSSVGNKPLEKRVRISQGLPSPRVSKSMTVNLKQQNNFNGAKAYGEPLLDPSKEFLYRSWRADYAELLYSWNLLTMRAEVLKYNAPWGSINHNAKQPRSSLTMGVEVTAIEDRPDTDFVIPISHCSSCGMTRLPDDTKANCTNCTERQATLCILCNHPIRGRSSPCFICGHVLHVSCRKSWQQLSPTITCPKGCECLCVSPTSPHGSLVTPLMVTAALPSFKPATPHSTQPLARKSSATTLPTGFRSTGPQDRHKHSSLPSVEVPDSILAETGTATPRTRADPPQIPQVAYAALQSLVNAQPRARGDSTGTHTSATLASDKDTALAKTAKIKPSKSLIFGLGVGGASNNSPQGESKKSRPSRLSGRLGSGSSTPSSTRGASTRHGSSGRPDVEASASRNHTAAALPWQQFSGDEELAFELGFDDEDDSDMEGRAF